MHRLTLLMCSLILTTGLVPAFAQPVEEAQKKLQGAWTATKAERDGSAADDVVGHRLSVTGNRRYALDGDTLRACDNAPNLDKGRPAAFEAKRGSGYVLITFKREKP